MLPKTSRHVIVKCFLVALWLVCLYRAITQSIVHDEALTYEEYVATPLNVMFNFYDANNHFLNTLLVRLSVALFGVSEWSVRLPALAAAGLYFTAVYQIAARIFRSPAVSFLAVALLTLNPFVLDFMVAARGYGLGLALFTYAVANLVSFARKEDPDFSRPALLVRAGIALALAIAANLVFAVPVVMAAAIAVLLFRSNRVNARPDNSVPILKKRPKKKASVDLKKPIPNPVYRYFLAPLAAVVFLFFLVAPFDRANSANFYVGAASIVESLRNLASASLAYGGFWRESPFVKLCVDAAAFVIAPVILLGALAVGIRRRDALLLFAAGTGLGSALILLLAHIFVSLPYPVDRTGIYFLVLVPLCFAGLLDSGVASGQLSRISTPLLYAFGLVVALQFALEFNVTSFLTWEYDADTRKIVDRLAQLASRPQPESVTVGASWQLEPSLNFYRDKQGLKWMRPVERGSLTPGANIYVIMAPDQPRIGALGLKQVDQWPRTGSVLAIPQPSR